MEAFATQSFVQAQRDVKVDGLDLSHLGRISQIHALAFPESTLTKLGDEIVRRYYEWQFEAPHDLVAIGVFVDGNLICFCLGGVFRGAMSGFIEKNRKFLICHVLTHPHFLRNPLFRSRLWNSVNLVKKFLPAKGRSPNRPASKRKSFGILAIATDPHCQGLGYGKLLMSATENIARQRGFEEMHLTVNPKNEKATRFYERIGWRKELQGDKWFGRMIKAF